MLNNYCFTTLLVPFVHESRTNNSVVNIYIKILNSNYYGKCLKNTSTT